MRKLGLWQILIIFFAGTMAISAFTGALTGLIIKSGIETTTNKLHNAQVAGCVRSNIQAAKDNKSQHADWVVDKFFVRAVKRPEPHQTPEQRQQARQFLQPIKDAVSSKTWTPLIANCSATIRRHGSNYILPQPVPFDKRVPPKSQYLVPPPPPLHPPASNHTP